MAPNDHDEAALVQLFESSLAALQQHAVIAAHLREHGWTLLAYTGACTAARHASQAA
jgi:hypothetical protein